jgi:hypothetical protein
MLHCFKLSTKPEEFNTIFRNFYSILETKSRLFNRLNSEEWKANATMSIDAKGNPQKEITMKYSIIYYADIMTHIMLLIDEKLLISNEELIKKVKDLLGELLTGFTNIDIKAISLNMDPIYFQDLIYVINKSLTLISRLLSKNKNIKPIPNNTQFQIMANLSAFIEKITNQGQLLIKVVIDLLKVSDTGTAK